MSKPALRPIQRWHPEERLHRAFEKRVWIATTVLTLVAAVGAISTVIISNFSLHEARKATSEAQNQVVQARRQAEAAENQINYAEDASRRQLRAYVGLRRSTGIVEMVCPDCDREKPLPLPTLFSNNYIRIYLKNFGQTPAYLPKVCAKLHELKVGEHLMYDEAQNTFSQCDKYSNISQHSTIWPTEERPNNAAFFQQEVEIIKKARNRTVDAVYYGRVSYVDIFDVKHNSYFCYLLAPTGAQDAFITCGTQRQQDN